MEPTTFAIVALAVAAAAFVHGTIGVGFALIVAPILGLLRPELLPTSLLIVMIPLHLYIVWRERSALDRVGATWITVGRFFGTFAGLWVLSILSSQALATLIGAATVLAAIVTMIAPRFTAGRKTWVVAGLVTGVTETSTGIGGPPLALAYQHHAAPVLRATLAFCFLVGEIISLVFLSVAGHATLPQLGAAGLLCGPLAVGALLSRYTHHRVNGNRLRWVVLIFAVVSGTALVFRA